MVTRKNQAKKSARSGKKYQKTIYAIAIMLATVSICIGIFFLISDIIPSAQRAARINTIYDSLAISDDYQPVRSDVFGKKRAYNWDSSRTYSSSKTFVRDANVDVTVSELRNKIQNAGFTYFEEPYPGSSYIQLHFKSATAEYIRMTVSSQPRDNALMHDTSQNAAGFAIDPNTGPSNVTVKVNLDDNNE